MQCIRLYLGIQYFSFLSHKTKLQLSGIFYSKDRMYVIYLQFIYSIVL